jgi:hypothetical protein
VIVGLEIGLDDLEDFHNHRAFDFRGKEQIYDVLARSAESELLAQIYLATRRSLKLANRDGARAKASWNVAGSWKLVGLEVLQEESL